MTFLLQSTVFPPENQISPVADQLRQMLATAPWARVGLGLPVVGSLVFVVTFFGPFTLDIENDWNHLSDILLILFLTVNLPGTFHQLNKHHNL